jgi:hypothetical protein
METFEIKALKNGETIEQKRTEYDIKAHMIVIYWKKQGKFDQVILTRICDGNIHSIWTHTLTNGVWKAKLSYNL